MVVSQKLSSITAPKATDIDITSAATLVLACFAAATIDIEGTALTGDLNLKATPTTIIKAMKIASINGSVTSNKVAQLHLPALTSVNTMSTDANSYGFRLLLLLKVWLLQLHGKVLDFNAPKLDVSVMLSL